MNSNEIFNDEKWKKALIIRLVKANKNKKLINPQENADTFHKL